MGLSPDNPIGYAVAPTPRNHREDVSPQVDELRRRLTALTELEGDFQSIFAHATDRQLDAMQRDARRVKAFVVRLTAAYSRPER